MATPYVPAILREKTPIKGKVKYDQPLPVSMRNSTLSINLQGDDVMMYLKSLSWKSVNAVIIRVLNEKGAKQVATVTTAIKEGSKGRLGEATGNVRVISKLAVNE